MIDSRYESTKMVGVFGIIGNLFLVIIKGVVGFFTNSQSMIADAFNSFCDIFSSVLTFIGNKIASVPRDDDHNLGHGKAEYIYSMLISVIMVMVSFKTFGDSFLSLVYGGEYVFSFWLIVVCIITICVKLFLYLYANMVFRRCNNLLIKASSYDHRNDCIVTFFNLVAALFGFFNVYFVDGVVGCCISVFIVVSAFKIFKESYDVLMDKSISSLGRDKVYEIIRNYPEIKRVNHFNSTPVGYRYQISFTIFVDGNMSTFDSHKIADRLEDEIEEKVGEVYLTVIHVNPI